MSGFCGYTTPSSGKAAGSLGFSLHGDPDKSKPLADTEGFIYWKVAVTAFHFTLYAYKPTSRIHLFFQ